MTPNAQSPSRHATTRVVSRTKPVATKLNIFRIERRNLPLLEAKLRSSGLVQEATNSEHGWETSFWFSELAPPVPFRWLELYADLLTNDYRNQHYSGVYILHHPDECFVVSHGTAHFSVRSFADPYFGIEMAKRIANEKDVQKRASRGYAGRKRKEVASFTPQSPLMIRSGDSVDLLSAKIAAPYQVAFGKSATFGGSMQITLKIDRHDIPAVCDAIVKTLAESEAFQLPTVVKLGEVEAAAYDEILINDLVTPDGSAELVSQGFEIVGVDIVFAESDSYRIKAKRCKPIDVASVDRETIRRYIKDNGIPPSEILDIRIEVQTEGSTPRTLSLKRSLDFVVPNENVALVEGRWMRFNEDYVRMLNRAVDHIAIDPTERDFELITLDEPTFNKSSQVEKAGYVNADRNFGLIDIGAGVPIEAYDLKRGDTVYAVKRGTPQKLGYVVDQATGVLEIIRNNADIAGFEAPKAYCLWLIFNRTTTVARLSDVDSIILKQKVETWAQQCMELGITPKLKFSRYEGSTRRRLKTAG